MKELSSLACTAGVHAGHLGGFLLFSPQKHEELSGFACVVLMCLLSNHREAFSPIGCCDHTVVGSGR